MKKVSHHESEGGKEKYRHIKIGGNTEHISTMENKSIN
jgi:hypothetical protein